MDGLLAEYGLDLDEVEVPSFDIPDGAHEFSIGDVFVKNGSKNSPDKSWIIIEYLVDDDGKRFSELYQLPVDATNKTEKEIKTLGRYKGRLLSLGIAESDVNTITREDLVGISGTFQLRTTKGTGGGEFQNIRNLRVNDSGANEFQASSEAPAVPKASAPKAAAKPATAVDNPFAKRD